MNSTWKTLFLGLFLDAALLLGAASDVPKPQPDWPTLPAVPDNLPPKPVAPQPATVLKGSDLYVVQSDDPVQLLASPSGVVSITVEQGPIRLRGTFADGTGKTETRVYSKKQVFIVERVSPGAVELLRVPVGPVDVRLLSDGGEPPRPPGPNPVVPPVPPVEASPWDNAQGLRVMLVYPSLPGAITAKQQTIITGAAVRDYVDAHCVKVGNDPQYFFWKTGEDVSGVAKQWQAAYKLVEKGGVVVGNGPKWEKLAIPAGPDEFLALLAKYQ